MKFYVNIKEGKFQAEEVEAEELKPFFSDFLRIMNTAETNISEQNELFERGLNLADEYLSKFIKEIEKDIEPYEPITTKGEFDYTDPDNLAEESRDMAQAAEKEED
jgi:predicted transcriptional regulator